MVKEKITRGKQKFVSVFSGDKTKEKEEGKKSVIQLLGASRLLDKSL